MNETLILADSKALTLEKITSLDGLITLVVKTTQQETLCPRCHQPSNRVHSHYQRQVADLPWQGTCVRMQLITRKFFCREVNCPQKIFCERIGNVVASYARQTMRLNDALRLIGVMLGGQAGTLLAKRLGMPISGDTLLRRIRQTLLPDNSTPRVLGVDDWAFQKGHRYGTLLVDLEKHRPVDLLPDRESSTLANWLKKHPGVEIISRDRALFYAEAAREGAPLAVQVADRWHLLKNLGEAVERFVTRNQSVLAPRAAKVTQCQLIESANQLEPVSMLSSRNPSEVAQLREQRYARYCEVRKLYATGMSQRDIARTTGISEPTIRKYIRAEKFPERAKVQLGSKLDPYIPYIHQRWIEGCENATQLWHEVKAKGYSGQVKMVERYIRRLRKQRKNLTLQQQRQFLQAQTTFKLPNARRVARWLLQPLEQLKLEQQMFIKYVCDECPEFRTLQNLALSFQEMIKQRQQVDILDKWLAQALKSQILEMKNFAVGIRQDYLAVAAALKYEWSNGQVEGQINKLKLIKRQMYGRAKLDLLKARMLYVV